MKEDRLFVLSFHAILIFAVILVFARHVEAVVTGPCSNCHTMHNSQQGMTMVLDPLGGQAAGGECQGCHSEPREELLVYTCVGCHAKSANSIDSFGGSDIPQVYYDTGGNELAAGNFKYIVENGHASGHNVHGWGSSIPVDSKLFWGPPGYVKEMDPSGFDYILDHPGNFLLEGPQVFCAGTFGCHGDRTVQSQTKATYGTHHANDFSLKFGHVDVGAQGSEPGKSYRYLDGVKGIEDDDWEATVDSGDHNEYYGADLGPSEVRDGSTQVTSVETMSQFCASCHGNFHMAGLSDGRGISTGGTNASPWIRHPTDVLIPDEPPYDVYNTYDLSARVARINLTALSPENTDIGTNAVVFCLSCHKAHASQYPDMLRFSYDEMLTGGAAGDEAGCFACHSDK